MLKKKDAIPGNVIVFNKNPLVSIVPMGKAIVNEIQGCSIPGGILLIHSGQASALTIKTNDTATIISKPKRFDGINCIQLRIKNSIGFFYWCDVYHNASLIKSGNGAIQEI